MTKKKKTPQEKPARFVVKVHRSWPLVCKDTERGRELVEEITQEAVEGLLKWKRTGRQLP